MGSKPTSARAYLGALDAERRAALETLRGWIREVVPAARETMSYKMPTYELGSPVCAIAAQKRHLALYVCETNALDRHREAFAHLDVGKGCIRFRSLDDLPRAAVSAVLRDAAAEAARP